MNKHDEMIKELTIKFKDMIEYAKCLKADIVYIYGNYIYGTDIGFSYLKQTMFNNELNLNICYIQKDMNNFMKEATDTIIFNSNMIASNTCVLSVNNPIHINSFNRLSTNVNEINFSTQPSLVIDDIRSNNEFEDSINLKASQGIGLCKVNEEYIITLFKNLLPINKKDKVSLEIRDLVSDRFMSRFTINKPKNVSIMVDIMYLKIK